MLDKVADGTVKWKTIIENSLPGSGSGCGNRREDAGVRKDRGRSIRRHLRCLCGRNMVVKIRPSRKIPGMPGLPGVQEHKPYLEDRIPCPKCGKDIVIKKTKKKRRYYGCENNPECDFHVLAEAILLKACRMWQLYMVEKGNKLLCSNEQCGYYNKYQRKTAE